MKKSLFLLLFFVFFTCNVDASSINYNLTIDDDYNFNEEIKYVVPKDTKNQYLKSIVFNDSYFDINNKYKYHKTVTKNLNDYTVVLKYKDHLQNMENSKILYECFDTFELEYDGYEYSFYTFEDTPFKCSNRADSINVNIKSSKNVIVSDADAASFNYHSWFNLNNESAPFIEIGELDPNSGVEPPVKPTYTESRATGKESEPPLPGINPLWYVGGGILSLLLVFFFCVLYFLKRRQKTVSNDDIYMEF